MLFQLFHFNVACRYGITEIITVGWFIARQILSKRQMNDFDWCQLNMNNSTHLFVDHLIPHACMNCNIQNEVSYSIQVSESILEHKELF